MKRIYTLSTSGFLVPPPRLKTHHKLLIFFCLHSYLVAINAIVFTYFVSQLVFIARLNLKGDLLSYDKRLILYVIDQVRLLCSIYLVYITLAS